MVIQWGDEVMDFVKRSVEIKVKDEAGNTTSSEYIIRESVHGPVVNEKDGKALCLTGSGP